MTAGDPPPDGALPGPAGSPEEGLAWDPEEALAQAALSDPAAEHLAAPGALASGPWRLLAVVAVALGALGLVFWWK